MKERIYRIAKVRKWGDYGDILMHGMLDKQRDSHVLFVCIPLEPLILPSRYLVCSSEMKSILQSIISDLTFFPCEIGHAVRLDWRSFKEKDEPKFYPPGGEPENCVYRGRPVEFLQEYWVVNPSSFCILKNPTPTFDFSRPLPLPQIDVGVPLPNQPIFAGRYSSSKYYSEYFFTEHAIEILTASAGIAVEFHEYNLMTGNPSET